MPLQAFPLNGFSRDAHLRVDTAGDVVLADGTRILLAELDAAPVLWMLLETLGVQR
ncbi:MAG: hypothetical protein H0X65_18020 [Gemmatimonadetes bacterium]|nr:hypothetical protein [Gemmatimonadota bacterium]